MPSLGASKVPQITAQSYDAHKVWRGKLLLTNLWSKENIVFIVHRYNMQHRVQEQGTQWAVSFRTGKEETQDTDATPSYKGCDVPYWGKGELVQEPWLQILGAFIHTVL